jgi:Cof subfamily protein (haloacid dehalogenase superfamily)
MDDKNIKLVLTDMDGTLLPMARDDVSESVKKVVKSMQDADIAVAAVTGRPYIHSKEVIDALGIEGLCVFSGGATVLDTRTGEIVWKQWIAKEYLRTIISAIKPFSTELAWNLEHDMVRTDTLDIASVDEDSQYVFGIYKETDFEQLKEAIESLPDLDTHYFQGFHPLTREAAPAFQINHTLATKHHGVEALRKIEHTPIENTLAIGDGNNDIALFKSAGLKIAMGNASDDLKDVADYVVSSVDEDGFVEAMNKYVLNK